MAQHRQAAFPRADQVAFPPFVSSNQRLALGVRFRTITPVKLSIALVGDILEVDFSQRETPEETREMIEAIFAALAEHRVVSVLIRGRESRPIFKVEGYSLGETLARISAIPGLRFASVTADSDLRASHDYVTLLASQRNVPMRVFDHEDDALDWLREPRD